MNILFLTFLYPTKNTPNRGIFIKEHAGAINSAGSEITVLVCNVQKGSSIFKKTADMYKDDNGIVTHYINIESVIYKLIYAFPPFMYSICRSYIAKNKLVSKNTIIHSNIIAPCGVVGYWLSEKYNVPHIITEHWSKVDKFMRLNVFSKTARKAYNKAIYITVVSQYLKERIKKYIDLVEKIEIIPNVINSSIFHYVPKIKSDKIISTAVATWEPPKLPHLFINALNEVCAERNIEVELNVVGKGTQLKLFKNSDYRFKINFMGQQSKEKIAQLLYKSDYFLHASEVETFSVVVAEALCTGTPVIASNVGALPELIESASDGILTNNNLKDWIDAINRAIDSKYNHQSISNKFTQRFSLSSIGSQFVAVYKKVAP